MAEAYAFINYLQKPEVAATNSNYVSYANGNLASQKFLDQGLLEDKTDLSGRGHDEPSLPPRRSRSKDRETDELLVDTDQNPTLSGCR